MKLYAINGSPRKQWNDAQLLEKFVEGVHSIEPDAQVEVIHVYDYKYTGCRSCFTCKLKNGTPLQCAIRDDIHELLIKLRNCDGMAIASPIYFCDISAQLRAFLERLMYPGPSEKEIPITCFYTMNADEKALERMIRPALDILSMYYLQNFKTKVQEVFAFDTLQRDHNDLYRPGHTDMEAKAIRRETQWPIDTKAAFDAGVDMVKRVKAISK